MSRFAGILTGVSGAVHTNPEEPTGSRWGQISPLWGAVGTQGTRGKKQLARAELNGR